ncbi:MAG: MBL fold metallo-hydrolase [Bacteroidales bacterium]|jgi:L-ascorbate metabolism protein UlaG (beta-lactamase superfamily)|nr:MBL fold metallo-hydrolase [Bacteroidales bacterium]
MVSMKFDTGLGDLEAVHLGHASLAFRINGRHIYVDPYSEKHDYENDPAADLILITHSHYDHYDVCALRRIVKRNTVMVVSAEAETMAEQDFGRKARIKALGNGESMEFEGIGIKAVPAYNIKHKKPDGACFHPRGFGNGYLLDAGGFKIYIAGDTEQIPEMKDMIGADLVFLPKNLPYTMSDGEFIAAANYLRPKYLCPVHYFEIDPEKLRAGISPDIKLCV